MATTKSSGVSAETRTDKDVEKPANVKPADGFTPSGAPDQVVPEVDGGHPAVDANPRAGTTEGQNQIDFNDPTKPGHEVVAEQLGLKTSSDESEKKD